VSKMSTWVRPLELEDSTIEQVWRALINRLLQLSRLHKGVDPSRGPLRILFYGQYGAGKSSLIGTFLSAFSRHGEPGNGRASKIIASESDAHVTVGLQEHKMMESSGLGLSVSLVDLFGFEAWNSQFTHGQKRMIRGILSGHLQNIERGKENKLVNVKHRTKITLDDEIHCVVLVVSAESKIKADKASKLQDVIGMVQDRGIPMVLAMTKCDKLGNDSVQRAFRNAPERIYTETSVIQAIQELSNQSGFPEADIYPVKPYNGEQQRDKYVEVMSLIALLEAMEKAENRYRQRRKEIAAGGIEGPWIEYDKDYYEQQTFSQPPSDDEKEDEEKKQEENMDDVDDEKTMERQAVAMSMAADDPLI